MCRTFSRREVRSTECTLRKIIRGRWNVTASWCLNAFPKFRSVWMQPWQPLPPHPPLPSSKTTVQTIQTWRHLPLKWGQVNTQMSIFFVCRSLMIHFWCATCQPSFTILSACQHCREIRRRGLLVEELMCFGQLIVAGRFIRMWQRCGDTGQDTENTSTVVFF